MKFNEFEYEHLDEKYLKDNYETHLMLLSKANDSKSFMETFNSFNKFRGHMFTMQILCAVRHSIDTSNEYYDKENEYWDNIGPVMQEYEVKMSDIILNCSFKNELNIPKTYFKLLENQKKQFSPAIIEDLQEENKLVSEYGKLKAGAKIEFNGETYNLSSIESLIMDEDRETRKNAMKAFIKFYEDNENQFDEIYDKLVKLRDKIAKKLGYKNYVELGYIRMDRLDYDEKMVAMYREQVVKDVVPIAIKIRQKQAKRLGLEKIECYDLNYKFKTGNPKPQGSIDDLVLAAKTMYSEMSEETKVFFETMVEQELFDLPTRPNKEMGGYCIGIYDYCVPFIFANSNGTSQDVDTLTHEAGHAFQAYMTMKEVSIPELDFGTMETAEIHSMSMEFFAHPWSKLFFKQDADKYHYLHICDSLTFLPYGCLVDHFQHEVFNHPEMSKEERKATWRRLEKIYYPDIDYEEFPLLERGGYFYRQGHIFQTPFYYIDYTLAQVCALQFYTRILNNDKNAWSDYVKICKLGGTKSFVEQVKIANLKVPFEEGCLIDVVKKMEEELDKIDDSKL
ncbi:MAG: M3 family oligoendopeptidase [Erysipelotrichaceae bacterium]|nr:M3 family oligoendopeptidase [Erysipelotrichaceae bacterium]